MTPILRLGRWQEHPLDEKVAVVLTDPPYGDRTMSGFVSGSDVSKAGEFSYEAWDDAAIEEFVDVVVMLDPFWAIVFNDDDTAFKLRAAFRTRGWYAFADVPWIKDNAGARIQGDGPASGAEHITVARPSRTLPKERIGSRPPWYKGPIQPPGADKIVTGQKPLWLIEALLRDYTLPGDVVWDPHAGSGSTLIGCARLGRLGIGSEKNEETYNATSARIARGWTPELI